MKEMKENEQIKSLIIYNPCAWYYAFEGQTLI